MRKPTDPYLDMVPERFSQPARVAAYVINLMHPLGLDPQVSVPEEAMFISYKWVPEDITIMMLQDKRSRQFKYLIWNCDGMAGDSPYFHSQYTAAEWLRQEADLIFQMEADEDEF